MYKSVFFRIKDVAMDIKYKVILQQKPIRI